MTKIVVIGAGIVGQATGKGLIYKGHKVIFVDIDTEIVKKLKQEGFDVRLPDELGNVDVDVSMFCVSTPPYSDGSVNLDYLSDAIIEHGKWWKEKKDKKNEQYTLVIRSTVPPGTTRKILIPLFEKYSGMIAGEDFGVCMQPEFLRAASSEKDFLHPWATVIGELDKQSGNVLAEIYSDFGGKMFRVDLETAEFVKYIHNTFNATKISFSNEMWLLGRKLGIDANLALKIASRTAEGFWNPSYGIIGGRPYGGSCLPKDTKALLKFADKIGIHMPLLSAVDSVNSQMEREAIKKERKGVI